VTLTEPRGGNDPVWGYDPGGGHCAEHSCGDNHRHRKSPAPKPQTPTIGPNRNYEGSKKQLCDQTSNKAFWVDILPGGATLLGGDYSPATVGEAGAGMAAGQAIDYVAGSPKALRGIRSWTGSLTGVSVPMTLTSKVLTYFGYAMTLYSGYHALNAGKDAYQACMAN
jgi:hypothetical protein